MRAYYPIDQGTVTNKFGFNDDDYPLQKHPVSLKFWSLVTLSAGLEVGKRIHGHTGTTSENH